MDVVLDVPIDATLVYTVHLNDITCETCQPRRAGLAASSLVSLLSPVAPVELIPQVDVPIPDPEQVARIGIEAKPD